MTAVSGLGLGVEAWAAIVCDAGARTPLGAAAQPGAIAASLRRRMPPFTLDAALCGLPLMQSRPESHLVYCSCNGDLSITVDLLTDLFRGELLSPAKFSVSVHNGPAGMIGLALARIGDHTAIAAGPDCLAAGLTDSYARLAADEADSVVLVLAEARLPAAYEDFDEGGPEGVFLGLALAPEPRGAGAAHAVAQGRRGAADLAWALQAGARRLRFHPPGAGSAPL